MSKGYEEGGEQLENLSAFTGNGFTSFPNTYEDNKRVGEFSTLTDEALANKTNMYGEFMQREDLMPRARKTGERILNHLIQELAYRDGVYPQQFREDELCDGNE